MTTQEKKIKNLFIFIFLLMGIAILIFTTLIVYKNLRNVHKEVFREYKEVYTENSNKEIKRAVEYFISSIKYEERDLLSNLKKELKKRVQIGYNIVTFFYKYRKQFSEYQLKRMTLEALKEADKNFAIFNKDGKILMSPCFKKGTNISTFQDTLGNKIFNIIKQDINYRQNNESFIACYTKKQNKQLSNYKTPSDIYKRIVYVKYFKPYGWYIVSSVLYINMENHLKNEIKAKINRYRYGFHKKNYIFVLRIDISNNSIKAVRIVNPNLPKKLINTVVPMNIKDMDGKFILKNMLKQAFTKGKGFVSYKFKIPGTNKIAKKITFVQYYPKWHWLICSGYYPEIFYKDLQTKDVKLKNIINKNLQNLIIWMTVFWIILWLIVLIFINNIMKIIKHYRQELLNKEQFQHLLMESVPNPLFVLDINGNFVQVNKSFRKFFYCNSEDACAEKNNPDIMLIKDKSIEYLKDINTKNPKEFNLIDDTGRLRYIELYSSIFYDSNKKKLGIVGILFDITMKKTTENELTELSIKDELTKLYNRRYFNQILPREIKRAKRYGHHLSLIMYDIDYFKRINDSFGHQAGDTVLKKISNIVTYNVRSVDLVFRIGGEEFIILLIETNAQDAYKVAEKIRKIVEKHDFKIGKTVTISLGVTEVHNDDSFDSIIRRIDNTLYKSKSNGRNKTTVI